MADKSLQDRLIKLLSGKPKKTETLAKIVQTLRVPKKSVNVQLYILQKEKRVVKAQDTPPVWALNDSSFSGNSLLSLSQSRAASGQHSAHPEASLADLEQKIIETLGSRQSPLKSHDIAVAVGLKKSGDVNAALYKLEEEGLLVKTLEKPQKWSLVGGSSTHNGAEAFAQDTMTPGIGVASFLQAQSLFDGFEPADDDGSMFTGETGMSNGEDEGISDNIQQDGFYDNQFSGDLIPAQEAEAQHFSDTENGGQVLEYCSLADSESGGLNSADVVTAENVSDPQFENVSVPQFDVFPSSEGGAECFTSGNVSQYDGVDPHEDNYSFLNAVGGDGDSWPVGDSEFDSGHRLDMQVDSTEVMDTITSELTPSGSPTEASEHISAALTTSSSPTEASAPKKAKTFRDVFNLGTPSPSYNEDSQDSVQEMTAPRNDSLGNIQTSYKDETVTLDQTQSNNENNDLVPSVDCNSTEYSSQLSSDGYENKDNDTLDHEMDSDKASEHTSHQMAHTLALTEMSETSTESQARPAEKAVDTAGMEIDEPAVIDSEAPSKTTEDMSECDIVLKALAPTLGLAQFVLKKKIDLSPDRIDDVLQNCLKLGYVSGSSKLWKITDEGKSYVGEDSDSACNLAPAGNNSDPFASQPFSAPKTKPKYSGPPPSPMALIKARSGSEMPVSVDTGRSSSTTSQVSTSSMAVQRKTHTTTTVVNRSQPQVNQPPNLVVSKQTSGSVARSESSAFNTSKNIGLPGQQTENAVKQQYNAKQPGHVVQSVRSQGIPPSPASIVKQSQTSPFQQEHASKSGASSFPERSVSKQTSLTGQQTAMSQSGILQFSDRNTEQSLLSGGQQASVRQAGMPSNVSSQQRSAAVSSMSSGLWDVDMTKSPSQANSSYRQTSPASATNAASMSPRNSANLFKQPPTVAQPPAVANTDNQARNMNMRKFGKFQEPAKVPIVIPSKYANYPNKSTSEDCLKKTTSTRKSVTAAPGTGAFNKGPPPSPMSILTKGLIKTEISSPAASQTSSKDSSNNSAFASQTLVSTAASFSLFSPSSGANVGSASQFSGSTRGGQFQRATATDAYNTGHNSLSSASGAGSITSPGFRSGTTTAPPSLLSLRPSAPRPAAPMSISQPTQNSLQLALTNESFNALNKNPISALMEYAQSRKMVARLELIGQKGSSHKPTFEIAAFVGKRKFPSVHCSNKKDGRQEASDLALRKLIAENQFQAQTSGTNSTGGGIPAVPASNMTHFDTVAALTHRGFTALVSEIKSESLAGRKVIAGLVMKRSEQDTGILISLGTGNRCITGQQLSLQGNTVNDSHAEIITRRGFLRFLYKQLLEYNPNKPHPMLEQSPNGKLRVRTNITFHLYISTAPCGDGALFSPRDVESSKSPIDTRVRPQHEPIFSSNVQGILRTKVEGGEGTIPIEAGFKGQTFDGIQRGERLRTMSCTDKVCRWNVVGMQGALLSHFLEPVYLDSLTLGLLYDHGHLSRAVCCRVGAGDMDINTQLPPGYRLNHPWLGRVTVCDPPREVQKTKSLSINWSFGDKGPEVTDGTQGLCCTSIEKGFFSRCSKRNLFMHFKALCEKFNRQDLLALRMYSEVKSEAQDFIAAKEAMLASFKNNGFGKWVSKPVEEEMFTLDDKN